MANPIILNSYQYTYGAGSKVNRKLDFIRDDDDPRSIRAKVSALYVGKWKEIGEIAGKKINVEMMSSSDKVKALINQREGLKTEFTPDKVLTLLSPKEQKELLDKLEPNGPWRIEITNGIGNDPIFEKVISLSLFNPS